MNTKSLLRWLSETPERGTVSRFLLIKNCGSRDELREVYGILLADRMSASDIDALFVPYGTHPLDRMAVRGA